MKRIIATVLSILMITCMLVSSVSAVDAGIMPCYNNTNYTNSDFYINSDGRADVHVSYCGYTDVTTGARITVQIQKKTMLFFWSDVDGAYWRYSLSVIEYSTTHSVYLSDNGDYRAVITYEIWGNGGSDDVIEHTLEYEY